MADDQATGAIAVGPLFRGTYNAVRRHRVDIAKRGLLPLVAMAAMTWGFFRATDGGGALDAVFLVVAALVGIAAIMHFAVSVHRLVLFGAAGAGSQFGLRFGLRELKFFGLAFLVNAADRVSELLGETAASQGYEVAGLVIIVASAVVITYFCIRWSLALPLIAADRKPALAMAWDLTRGKAWKFFLGYLAVFAPLMAVAFLLILVGMGAGLWLLLPIFAITYVLATAILASFLSTAYMQVATPAPAVGGPIPEGE